MDRREAMKFMTAALAGTSIAGAATAAPWQPQSTMLVYPDPENRSKRYERYASLARELFTQNLGKDDTYVLGDQHMQNIGKMLHDGLKLDNEDDKNIFNPFRCGSIAMYAAVFGDVFVELLPSWCQMLPCDTVYRIETVKGKLLEFQQSRIGPDYVALTKQNVEECKDENSSLHAIRFHPNKIVHIRPKCYKYYPYGTSALETGTPVLDADWYGDVFLGIKEAHKRMRII